MRPVFEEPPLALPCPSGSVEESSIVCAEPREGRQVVGPGEDVHAVDLMEAQPIHKTAQMPSIDALWTHNPEALRGEHDPTCSSGADPFRHRPCPVS